MRYAINLPNVGEYSDPQILAEIAHDAEAAGWDGVFVWDHMLVSIVPPLPATDPWIALAAIALSTERVKIGPMVTPLARRNPSKVARELITLDRLSGGRTTLGVGLGAPVESEFEVFGEESDAKIRAGKLDEALEVVAGLCSGQPFQYSGQYYQIQETALALKPIQPHIPIWVAGWWPNKAPMRRAARWDGAYPVEVEVIDGELKVFQMSPDTAHTIVEYIGRHRTTAAPFDMVVSYDFPADDPAKCAEVVQMYAEVGVTWMIQEFMPWGTTPAQTRERVCQGPPLVEYHVSGSLL
ncbi:MAG TPA: LLM class flavin-dependent oxidoreductase [Herpetosiphonaceae bacterium]